MMFRIFPRKNRLLGFTLIELMVVLTLIAILATIGIPSFREMIKNNRVTGQNNELVALLNFAKSEAVRRSTNVDVIISRTTVGWDGDVPDPEGDADVVGCPTGFLRCSSNSRVFFDEAGFGTSSELAIRFNSRGYLTTPTADPNDPPAWDPSGRTLRLQHENCQGPRQARIIEILPTGQISSQAAGCAG